MNKKPIELKRLCAKWKGEGLTQKEIAEKLQISEKTISLWVKKLPQTKAQKFLSKLQDRLNREANTLTPDELVRLTDSMSKTYKIAFPDW